VGKSAVVTHHCLTNQTLPCKAACWYYGWLAEVLHIGQNWEEGDMKKSGLVYSVMSCVTVLVACGTSSTTSNNGDATGAAAAAGNRAASGGSDGSPGGATSSGGVQVAMGGSIGVGGTWSPTGGTSSTADWPSSNTYSWDGSWNPSASEFPLSGLLDPKYNGTYQARDGSKPALPPGKWDWKASDDDLANWANFASNVGTFTALKDAQGHQYGWQLVLATPTSVDVDARGGFLYGSSGSDIFNLGAHSKLASFAEGNLGDGPDILVFNASNTLDFRTGSTSTGSLRDNDLVVAGCVPQVDATYLIQTTTIHTGPGSDWVFIRDFTTSAIDLGNGANGRTDSVDSTDGDDQVVIRGNSHDFRIFGGNGKDTLFWYVDDNVHSTQTGWLGPNFFGTGGAASALWGTDTDRLVLVIPSDTPIVYTDDTVNGTILIKSAGANAVLDDPTQGDPYAAYCVECGTGPGGRKTLILSYRSTNGQVFTAYSYLTDIEELQVGVGDTARVYRLDDIQGKATLDLSLNPVTPPTWPSGYCG
jgi:hypothetical protein